MLRRDYDEDKQPHDFDAQRALRASLAGTTGISSGVGCQRHAITSGSPTVAQIGSGNFPTIPWPSSRWLRPLLANP